MGHHCEADGFAPLPREVGFSRRNRKGLVMEVEGVDSGGGRKKFAGRENENGKMKATMREKRGDRFHRKERKTRMTWDWEANGRMALVVGSGGGRREGRGEKMRRER
ncbi:hypothetical protein ACH5RR_034177 [Cinchona calisaya]|uniref:Uncharacterized protein n=1 Tax=Cinchona calisaya TaxID=153742 RepID=A0ABD2YA41_9GENT